MKRKPAVPVFKPYEMNQPHLMPPSLDELIDEHHLVRVVNQVIDKFDLKTVVGRYTGGGTSS